MVLGMDMDVAAAAKLAYIIWIDIVLSGDNALVIGLAASTLPGDLRRKAIIFGLTLATTIRILFAGATTYFLNIPGLLFAGGLALLWVSWSLYREIPSAGSQPNDDGHEPSGMETGNTLFRALVSITVADISMSIDNVLAVAAIAREEVWLLVFGLALSIALMGLGATLIMRFLLRYRWISYVGVLLLVALGLQMMWEGWPDVHHIARGVMADMWPGFGTGM